MAKISASKGRPDANSGYARLFGSDRLGQLMSRVHATVIRAGNELEHIIFQATPDYRKTTLNAIRSDQSELLPRSNVQVAFKCEMPGTAEQRGATTDLVIFDHSKRWAAIIELKDGDTFDTKKASGERASTIVFSDWLARQIGHEVAYYFCSFNQDNKEAIVRGAKGRFDIDHAMTGRELRAILGIDLDSLRKKRQGEQSENLTYFLTELMGISEIRRAVKKLLTTSTKGTTNEP